MADKWNRVRRWCPYGIKIILVTRRAVLRVQYRYPLVHEKLLLDCAPNTSVWLVKGDIYTRILNVRTCREKRVLLSRRMYVYTHDLQSVRSYKYQNKFSTAKARKNINTPLRNRLETNEEMRWWRKEGKEGKKRTRSSQYSLPTEYSWSTYKTV
jgi:hypothetical protein